MSANKRLFTVLVAVLFTAAGFAQNPAQQISRATLVLPVPGAPLAAHIVEERSSKLPDGTSQTEVLTSTVYRDSAGRYQFSKKETTQGGYGFSTTGSLITAPGKKTSKTESLGKQTMDGIEYEGTRTTTTLEDQPSMTGVEEQWTAPLGLIGLTKSAGPDMQITAKIRDLDRRAPDPALFQIPSDYFIRDLNRDGPAQ